MLLGFTHIFTPSPIYNSNRKNINNKRERAFAHICIYVRRTHHICPAAGISKTGATTPFILIINNRMLHCNYICTYMQKDIRSNPTVRGYVCLFIESADQEKKLFVKANMHRAICERICNWFWVICVCVYVYVPLLLFARNINTCVCYTSDTSSSYLCFDECTRATYVRSTRILASLPLISNNRPHL